MYAIILCPLHGYFRGRGRSIERRALDLTIKCTRPWACSSALLDYCLGYVNVYATHKVWVGGRQPWRGEDSPLALCRKNLLLLILCTPFQLVWLGMSLRDYCIAGKFGGELNFGGLAVWSTTTKLKSANISYSHNYVRMVIPYQTSKFKSTNIFAIAILGPTAKFNSCQYFQLYGISLCLLNWKVELQ